MERNHETPDEYDPLSEVELFIVEPKVATAFAVMKEEQKKLTPEGTLYRDDEQSLRSRTGCYTINSILGQCDLLDDTVTLYGKVRMAPWVDEVERDVVLLDQFFSDRGGLQRGCDERGEYWQLADHKLKLCPADTDEVDGSDDPISYVMTLRTLERAREIQDDDLEEEMGTRGELIMYPDDIDVLTPGTPSYEYVEAQLRSEYPALYEKIIDLLPENSTYDEIGVTLTDTQRIGQLMQLTLDNDLSLTAEFRKGLGSYLLTRVDIDEHAEYIFRGYDSLEGLDEDGEWVEYEGKRRKLRGTITAIDIDASYRISCIITALMAEEGAGYGLYRMPGHHNITAESTREKKRRFGSRVMREFESRADVARWLLDRQNGPVTELDEFAAITKGLDMQEVEFQDKGEWHEVSVDDDLDVLRRAFAEHREAVLEMIGEDDVEAAAMMPSLDKDIQGLEDITIDEPYVFSRELKVIPLLRERSQAIDDCMEFGEADGMRLRGRVVDFCGAWFPFSSDMSGKKEFALAAVVESPCLLANNDDDQVHPLAAEVALVYLGEATTRGYRVITKVSSKE